MLEKNKLGAPHDHNWLSFCNNKWVSTIQELFQFVSKKQLKIKEKKSELIKFNISKNHDFRQNLKSMNLTKF